ncbi:lytic transglycosylase domain-containing protein [Comamonas testosteroni]|uniref:lytic transglycosylase domain-containing protein n=1 Tax=Comamonas testosteroni TaxID=285 RepID=UPI0026EF2B90|nr:lytic transglycosylase domain-containing protein [Comamonas testosteroni]
MPVSHFKITIAGFAAAIVCSISGQAIAMGLSLPVNVAGVNTNGLQAAVMQASMDPIADAPQQGPMPASLLGNAGQVQQPRKTITPPAANLPSPPLASAPSGLASQEQGVAGLDPVLGELIARCAPTVHPETMAAVISAESRGHQFAIADAGPVHLPWSQRKSMVRSLYPSTVEEAVATAQSLISRGHTVSLGVGQVNDRNLARMGVSVKDMFDPCLNLSAAAKILTDFYERAVKKFGNGPGTLQAALSAYNSGDWTRGARDGYVNLIYQQVGRPLALRSQRVVPKLSGTSPKTPIPVAVSAPAATGMSAVRYSPTTQRPSARVPREFGGQREFTMKASNFSVAEMR